MRQAVIEIVQACIGAHDQTFSDSNSRSGKGFHLLLDDLRLDTPIAGFNGGLFVTPQLAIIEQKTLPDDIAARAIELTRGCGLDAWVYRGNDWLITKADAPHVARTCPLFLVD